jgi:hypothetical protein
LRWFQLGWTHNFILLGLGKIHYLWISLLGDISDLLGEYPLTLLTTCSIVPFSYVLIGGIQCLHDDTWFYDIACVGSLKWVFVYCGSSHSSSLIFSLSLLVLSQIPNQMESSNTNHEDKDNEGNINIPLATSSLERKMSEYIATQT